MIYLYLIMMLMRTEAMPAASELKQHPINYVYQGHIPGMDLWKLKNRNEMHKCLQ